MLWQHIGWRWHTGTTVFAISFAVAWIGMDGVADCHEHSRIEIPFYPFSNRSFGSQNAGLFSKEGGGVLFGGFAGCGAIWFFEY